MERWNQAYREAPEVFDAFTRAEDPDRLVVRTLVERAGLAGRTVLEIGCGTGRYTCDLAAAAGHYLALERSAGMLALALANAGDAPRPGFLCARAERLPLADRSVQRVIAGWVLVNMPGPVRAAVLAELDRVLAGAADAATWAVENDATGEFQDLRGRNAEQDRARLDLLVERDGFEHVARIQTELRFPSTGECERILGYLCGDAVRDRLRREPRRTLSHHVVILRRPARS